MSLNLHPLKNVQYSNGLRLILCGSTSWNPEICCMVRVWTGLQQDMKTIKAFPDALEDAHLSAAMMRRRIY